MNKFVEIPASKQSLVSRRPIQGVGINDAPYMIKPVIDGVEVICPIYNTWVNLINRCYSKKTQIRQPAYKGCTVSDEWLTFTRFRSWMITKIWKGLHLDKDIVKTGNKVYSKESCIFVTQEINKLLTINKSCRGDLPIGVAYYGDGYRAVCSVNNKGVYLGVFSLSSEAHKVYKVFKSNLILEVAERQSQPLKKHLIRISEEILDGSYFN